MTDRMVQCARLGRELPGLEKPPFSGKLGQRIFESVSRQAWADWEKGFEALMSQRRWNLADPQARAAMSAT